LQHTLRELLFQGAITIATPTTETGRFGAVTIIQADGDVLMKVTPEFLNDDVLQSTHRRALVEQVEALRRIRARVRWGRMSILGGSLATTEGVVFGLLRDQGVTSALLRMALHALAAAAAVALARWVARALVRKFLLRRLGGPDS
jgi:hypothetical protein